MDRQRRPGLAGRRSRWWPPIWPSRSGPGCRPPSTTPAGSPTRSTSCGSATAALTRSAAGSRTRRSATVAASPTRCIGSASCCSPAPNASTNAAASGCCSGLRVGDPNDELLGAWLAKESVRDVYLADTLGRRRARCSTRPSPAASPTTSPRSAPSATPSPRGGPRSSPTTTPAPRNGPTEGLNLCVKKVKRCGHGFRTFEHYRLRVLLHAGGITWPERPDRHASEPALPTQTRRAGLVQPVECG